jgi:CDP-diglyceride synthetase
MLTITILASVFQRKTILPVSLMISLLIIAANVYYFMRRKKSLKYKLFSSIIVALNCVFPIFYVFCTVYYTKFGFKSMALQYLLPFLIITFFAVLVNVALNKRSIFRKSRKSTVISGSAFGVLAFLIGRKMNTMLSSALTEDQHFLTVAFLILLLMCVVVSAVFIDMLRYYYFTKLEKQGLVTDDILKAEE